MRVFLAGEIMVLLFVCSLIPQVMLLLGKFGVVSSWVGGSQTATLALVELASISFPLYGVFFVVLCVRCSSQLRAKAQKAFPGAIGKRFFTDPPPIVTLDAEGQEKEHFAGLAKAWS